MDTRSADRWDLDATLRLRRPPPQDEGLMLPLAALALLVGLLLAGVLL